MVKKIILSLIGRRGFFIVIIILLTGAGCNVSKRNTVYNSSKSGEINIGAAYPVSSIRAMNTHFEKGLEFAVNSINNNGGILNKRLNIVVRDDRNNANIAMQIAETFSEQGITAVIGHWSSNVSYYTQDIYEKNKVVMLTPRSTGLILFDEKFDYIFRMVGSNRVFAQVIALHMIDKGYNNVAMFFSEDVFGIDLAKIFEKEFGAQGIRVVDRVTSITPLNVDLLLNRWNAFGCDGIVVASSYPVYVEPVKIIRRSGSRLPVYGDDSLEGITPDDLPNEYLDGLYVVTLNRAYLDTGFLEGFRSQYGHDPDTPAVNGYEAVKLLKDAMEAVQSTDGTAIAQYLSNLKDYKTVSGARTYNPETQEFDGYNAFVSPVGPIIFAHTP